MEPSELKARMENPEGWYLFAGEEEFLKRYYLSELKKAIVKDEYTAPFNYTVFDGPEIDVSALTEAIAAPPMMSDYKLVVWKYADFEKMKESAKKAFDDFCLLKKEYPYTVLVFLVTEDGFGVGNLPKRPSKLYSKYAKVFDVVVCRRSTDAQLLSWLKRHFDAEGVSASATALNALLFRAGHDMDVLLGEVEKLAAFVKANGRREVTKEDVELVASSTLECDTFALSNALQSGDKRKVFFALEELRNEKTEPTVILGMLTKVYTEMLFISYMLEEGKNSADISAALGVPDWKIQKEIPAVKKLGAGKLSCAVAALSDIDTVMKSGSASFTPIETFLTQYV
ncbi:MAG: DNA polymerase III subunit delta [Clostridia bacterium]|nr:DNA polymerase III subunit delta [Clostridia bacterium]